MFLDLKGSTTIAEQLGHRRYSSLIQDCFRVSLQERELKHLKKLLTYIVAFLVKSLLFTNRQQVCAAPIGYERVNDVCICRF